MKIRSSFLSWCTTEWEENQKQIFTNTEVLDNRTNYIYKYRSTCE